MMDPDGKEHHGDIVVVHRHGDHEDGHHGGAWKIAFADFMTAMMAFFLVMWLINSTDEQTLSQVATYFSPIKLTDRDVTERGVHDSKFGGSGNEKEKHEQKKKEGKNFMEPVHEPGEKRFPEEELFADPYDKLAKLAVQATRKPPRPGGGLKQEGHAGGEAFRDPFDPDFRSSADDGPIAGADAKLKAGTAEDKSGKGLAAVNPDSQPNPEANAQPGPEMAVHPSKRGKMEEASGDALGEEGAFAGKPGKTEEAGVHTEDGKAIKRDQTAKKVANAVQNVNAEAGRDKAESSAENTAEKAEKAETTKKETQAAGEEKPGAADPLHGDSKEIRQMVAMNDKARRIEHDFMESVQQGNLASIPDITVSGTPDGVLISLTDKSNFEMFAIGSAEPRPELVVVMEKLGKVLQTQKGDIVIRGHTDSRPYRSKIYDNWRLSTSRAHMSYFMLVRAGVPKNRIERIEGYADRNPRNPKNPRAAENRRIEILLRPSKS